MQDLGHIELHTQFTAKGRLQPWWLQLKDRERVEVGGEKCIYHQITLSAQQKPHYVGDRIVRWTEVLNVLQPTLMWVLEEDPDVKLEWGYNHIKWTDLGIFNGNTVVWARNAGKSTIVLVINKKKEINVLTSITPLQIAIKRAVLMPHAFPELCWYSCFKSKWGTILKAAACRPILYMSSMSLQETAYTTALVKGECVAQ